MDALKTNKLSSASMEISSKPGYVKSTGRVLMLGLLRVTAEMQEELGYYDAAGRTRASAQATAKMIEFDASARVMANKIRRAEQVLMEVAVRNLNEAEKRDRYYKAASIYLDAYKTSDYLRENAWIRRFNTQDSSKEEMALTQLGRDLLEAGLDAALENLILSGGSYSMMERSFASLLGLSEEDVGKMLSKKSCKQVQLRG